MPRTCSGDATLEMPLRKWNIELYLVGPHGEDLPADCFEKVVYKLHETFGQRAMQSTYIRINSKPALFIISCLKLLSSLAFFA